MSNFKIAFFTKAEYKENFENEKSNLKIKQNNRTKKTTAYGEQNAFIKNPINTLVTRTIFCFSTNSTLAI